MKTTRLMLIMLVAVALAGCGMFGGSGDSPATDENAELSTEVDCLETPLDPACTAQDESAGEAEEEAEAEETPEAVVALLILDEAGWAITSTSYDDGAIGTVIAKSFDVSGATGAVSWTATDLPADASFEPGVDGTSVAVSWTPAISGKFKFSLTASDEGSGLSKTATITLKVHEEIVLSPVVATGTMAAPASIEAPLTIDHNLQALAIEIPNRAKSGYVFTIKGDGYAITKKPCKDGAATCRAVISPDSDIDLNRALGSADVTVRNEAGDEATLRIAGVTFEKRKAELDDSVIDRVNTAMNRPVTVINAESVEESADEDGCKLGKISDAAEILILPLIRENGHYDDDVKFWFSLESNDVWLGETTRYKIDPNDNGKPDDNSPELSIVKFAEDTGATCIEEIDEVRVHFKNPGYALTSHDGTWHKIDVHVDRLIIKVTMKPESETAKPKAYYAHVSQDFGKEDYYGTGSSWGTGFDTCDSVSATDAYRAEENEFGETPVTWCKGPSQKPDPDVPGVSMFDWHSWME